MIAFAVIGSSLTDKPILYKTGVKFSNGCATIDVEDMTDLDGNVPGAGKLSITNLPASGNYAVGVYDYSGEIDDMLGWAEAAASVIAAGQGNASSSVTLYKTPMTNPPEVFNNTGTYMVALVATPSPTETVVLYKTGVSFTNGSGSVDVETMTDLLGNGPGSADKGKLTVANFPTDSSFTVGVYDFAEEVNSQTDITTVQTDLDKLLAGSVGMASSSPVSLMKNGMSGSAGVFDGTETYLVMFMRLSPMEVRFAAQVEFTNGCADIDFDEMRLTTDLPETDPPDGLTSIADITAYLNNNTGTQSEPLPLKVAMDLGTLTEAGSGWRQLLDALAEAGDFVALDLSACTMNGTEFNPDNTVSTGKDKIVTIALPDDAESIPDSGNDYLATFGYFTALESFSGLGLTRIGQSGFYGLNLTMTSLPKGITYIDHHAFLENRSLTEMTLHNGIVFVGALAFGQGRGLTQVTLPDTITVISWGVFEACTNLPEIILPAGITSIESYAFSGCSSLELLICNAVTPPTFSPEMTLNNTPASLVIRVPAASVDAYKAAPGWSNYANRIQPILDGPATSVSISAIEGVSVPATGATPAAAITANSQFSGSVIWNPNHTSFQAGQTYTATITLEAAPGYTFEGVDADFFTVAGAESVNNDAGSNVVSAVFPVTKNRYTVTFESNGGSPIESESVIEGSRVTRPDVPPRTSHTFGGWFEDDEAFEDEWIFESDTVTDNITLYAKWTINQYTVSFNSNGGDTVSDLTGVEHGSTITAPEPPPVKDGANFGGWYKDSGFADDWDFAADTVTSNTALYARWTHTVSFDSKGGSAVNSQTVTSGTAAIRPADNPTLDDQGFIDWYSDEGLTTIYNFADPVTGDITIYARWGILAVSTEDVADFGSGAVIADTFNVATEPEWDSVKNAINTGGTNKNYIINVTDSFGIPASVSYPPAHFTQAGTVVSIRGTGTQTLSLSSNGYLLSTVNTVIIRDLTLKGRTNGVDGADSDNDSAVLYVYDGTLELKGTTKVTGNVNRYTGTGSAAYGVLKNGGGIEVYHGEFIMRDSSSVTGNTIALALTDPENTVSGYAIGYAFGGGVSNLGRMTMWDNASVTGNAVISSISGTNAATGRIRASGGGIFNMGSLYLRGTGVSITGNSVTASGGDGNSGGFGGGIYNQSVCNVQYAAISGNTASSMGASLCVHPDGAFGQDSPFTERGYYGWYMNELVWLWKGNLGTTSNPITITNGDLQ